MGDFRSDGRGRFGGTRSGGRSGGFSRGGDRGGFGGRSGGRGGFRDRDSGPREMHEVTCDSCKKQCEVPFKPTGDKPVYCSDCFRKQDSGNFESRNRNFSSGSSQGGMSKDQFDTLNKKLDKIIEF